MKVGWLALGLLGCASSAVAQATPTASPTPPAAKTDPTASDTKSTDGAKAKPDATVTVTGKASAFRSSIDRRSYSLANDLQKTTGSVADVLANVPSVNVDPHGVVSLRGDPNVTILIDGKPSTLLQGPNRGDYLQQLSAADIDRVEVMTNPSAAFSPEGTGGIINLITRPSKKSDPKRTGSLSATLGSDGRYLTSLNQTLKLDRLTLSGSLSLTHNAPRYHIPSVTREIDPVTGQFTTIDFDQKLRQSYDSQVLKAGVDYDLDDQTRIGGELSYTHIARTIDIATSYRSAALSGPLAEDYDESSNEHFQPHTASGTLSLVRKLGGDDHEISIRLSRDFMDYGADRRDAFTYLRPSQPNLFQDLASPASYGLLDFKAEYKGPLPDSAKLLAGYEMKIDDDRFDYLTRLGVTPADAVVVPALSNLFKFTQTVHALYATYQRPFGPLTVQPGLRLEDVLIDANLVTPAARDRYDYFRAYPTLHLSYKLDEHQDLTASYSQRVQRPSGVLLNPFRIYSSPLDYRQGNSRLQPQITTAYEVGYAFRQQSTYYLATLFYRDNRKVVTDVLQDLGGGVILSSFANLGHSRNAGLELVANGEIVKSLTYTVTGSLYRSEIDPDGLALAVKRVGIARTAKVNLNWNPTPNDFVQVNFLNEGREYFSQGYGSSTPSFNIGYRHKFDDKLALVLKAQDPFDTYRYVTVIDTPTLQQNTFYRARTRVFMIGFTYALGSAKSQTTGDFGFSGAR